MNREPKHEIGHIYGREKHYEIDDLNGRENEQAPNVNDKQENKEVLNEQSAKEIIKKYEQYQKDFNRYEQLVKSAGSIVSSNLIDSREIAYADMFDYKAKYSTVKL